MSQMATAIIGDLVKMGVEFVIQQGVMYAARLIFGNADAAASNAQAQAAQAAWTPAAVAASISSYGIAAAVGQAAALSAIGSSAAFGSFASGGYTGDGGRYDVAGVVHRGEYVIDSHTLSRGGGPAAFDYMRAQIHSSSANSVGAGIGPVAASGHGSGTRRANQSGENHLHVVLVNSESEAKSYLSSARGISHVARLTKQNRRRMGIKV